jgi:hypothetical protein
LVKRCRRVPRCLNCPWHLLPFNRCDACLNRRSRHHNRRIRICSLCLGLLLNRNTFVIFYQGNPLIIPIDLRRKSAHKINIETLMCLTSKEIEA